MVTALGFAVVDYSEELLGCLQQQLSPWDWTMAVPGRFRIDHVRLAYRQFFYSYATLDSDLWAADLIIAELIANVERYALGAATFHVNWQGEHPVVTVFDDGPGFATDARSSLDDPYADSGRGLEIVRSLAYKMSFGNLPGSGAYVCVLLPLRRSPLLPLEL